VRCRTNQLVFLTDLDQLLKLPERMHGQMFQFFQDELLNF